MVRSTLLMALLFSVPAWATGERIVLSPASNPLGEALCISMTCVKGGARDFVVSSRPAAGGVEFVVTHASGRVHLVHLAKLNGNGKVGSTDLARAATLAIKAIETRPPPMPQKVAKRVVKHPRLRLMARR